MHKFYFPNCKVSGPIEPPIKFSHLGSVGAVPNKCSNCSYLFEGSCTRNISDVGRYLHLDYGKCKINGSTDPVYYEDSYIQAKVEIPKKCSECAFLNVDSIYGFYCSQDKEKWGDFHRGLDWGSWEPNSIYLELPQPKLTTKELSVFAKENNEISFIKEHRRINPGLSLSEAKEDFIYFRSILEKNS